MSNLDQITSSLVDFRKQRDWEQFHNPKNLAESIVLEAAELMEHFQWKNPAEVLEYAVEHKDELGQEIADIIIYILYLCHDLGINPIQAVEAKMKLNESKYPVERSKGSSKKYTELTED